MPLVCLLFSQRNDVPCLLFGKHNFYWMKGERTKRRIFVSVFISLFFDCFLDLDEQTKGKSLFRKKDFALNLLCRRMLPQRTSFRSTRNANKSASYMSNQQMKSDTWSSKLKFISVGGFSFFFSRVLCDLLIWWRCDNSVFGACALHKMYIKVISHPCIALWSDWNDFFRKYIKKTSSSCWQTDTKQSKTCKRSANERIC